MATHLAKIRSLGRDVTFQTAKESLLEMWNQIIDHLNPIQMIWNDKFRKSFFLRPLIWGSTSLHSGIHIGPASLATSCAVSSPGETIHKIRTTWQCSNPTMWMTTQLPETAISAAASLSCSRNCFRAKGASWKRKTKLFCTTYNKSVHQ